MSFVEIDPKLGVRARIARAIAGSFWPQPTPDSQDTTVGATEQMLDLITNRFFSIKDGRQDVYDDVIAMDNTMDEVATALDMLADNATAPDAGASENFIVSYLEDVDEEVKALIDGVLNRTQWREKAYEIARGMLLMGDEFRQFVIDLDNLEIVRLMYMPPQSMYRNEDHRGLLKMGNTPGEWGFEQKQPKTDKIIVGFYPYQIMHLRWNKSGSRPYGRSLLYTARTSWRKLQAMEEALVINWITRAFARLLFILDTTGKGPKEAQAAIDDFKRKLQTRKLAKDVHGFEQLSIVKDIFVSKSWHDIGGRAEASLTDVKVLDTSSSGYQQIQPIDYFRSKILMDLRTPKAYLGLEEDINAKATLVQEDRRYRRFLQRIQTVLTEGIQQTINLQLALHKIDFRTIPYVIEWKTPSWTDIAEEAQAMSNFAAADAAYLQMGVIDKKWISANHLGMTDLEYEAVQERVAANPPKEPTETETENSGADEGEDQ